MIGAGSFVRSGRQEQLHENLSDRGLPFDVSLQAQAISRYTSTSMSCDEVKATIKREGAAIMQYQSKRVAGLPLYNRYVRDRTFCPGDQTTQTTYIPAAGGKSCPVRKCVEIEFFDR